jgi:N-acetylneuraminate synthase
VRTLVIAEVGSVHDGSLGNALRLVDAASECGVDAVKFQTHIADAETLADAPSPTFFDAEPRAEYFRRTAFTLDQWSRVKRRCEEREVMFLSSPFSEQAVDLLEGLGVLQYKVASGEVTNLPMLQKIARLGKPVLLSSGMSSWEELDRAVGVLRQDQVALTVLQCTTEYPCPYERVGLNVMLEMKQRYGTPVGLSDHTLTPYASLAAVALGASVVERHFTFSRKMYGSDAPHSLEPPELAELVRGIRAIEAMLAGPVDKDDLGPFREVKKVFEKSVVSTVEIPAGSVLTREMLAIKKPGTGLSASRLESVLGRRTTRAIRAGVPLLPSDVAWEE